MLKGWKIFSQLLKFLLAAEQNTAIIIDNVI